MHFSTDTNDHSLRHDPFKALIVPRPIGWITTVSSEGILNVAPYSFFNGISDKPPMVMFSVAGVKDTLTNIQDNGECTCSLATDPLSKEMNITSAPVQPDVSEFNLADLPHSPSMLVNTPRISASPAALECRHWKSVPLPGAEQNPAKGYTLVLAEVVAIYIDDNFIADGLVDTGAMQPLARLGYMDYMSFDQKNVFTLSRPEVDETGRKVLRNEGGWDGMYR